MFGWGGGAPSLHHQYDANFMNRRHTVFVSVLWQSVLPWTYLSYSSLSCLWTCLSYTSLYCFGLFDSVLQQTVLPRLVYPTAAFAVFGHACPAAACDPFGRACPTTA